MNFIEIQDVSGNDLFINPAHVMAARIGGLGDIMTAEFLLVSGESVAISIGDDGYAQVRALLPAAESA